MIQCQYCSTFFPTAIKYQKHLKNRPKKCIQYQDITFVCTCNFTTKGFQIIKKHQQFCKGVNIPITNSQLKNIIYEKIKYKFFKSIENQIIIEKNIIVQVDTKDISIKSESKINKRTITNLFKQRYDFVNNKNFDEVISNYKITYSKFNSYISKINTQNIKHEIETILDEILINTNINVDELGNKFAKIKTKRASLFLNFKGGELQKFVNSNYNKLLSFLFNYNKKISKSDKDRLSKILSNSLNGIEGRLLNNIDIKDQGIIYNLGEITDTLKNIYFNQISHTITRKPQSFRDTNFFEQIKNPFISVAPFVKYIETFIISTYTIIYYEDESKEYDKNDPYSIYILDKTVGDVKYWTMDTRAENFALEIIDCIKSYCIDIFIKLWKFDKNNIHKDDASYIEIAKTIFLLCDPIELSNKIRFILFNRKKYIKTDKDIFNMKCDDLIQKQKFKEYIKEDDAMKVVISEMFSFEDIETYNIDEFINNILKN